jgi:hypothetical protein
MVQGTISVIIPAHNAADTLLRCLESLVRQEDSDYEIIVVDDGSTDATANVASRFDCLLLRNEEHAGPAISRNRGADAAKGAVLAFTDADCVPPPDWLSKIRTWLEVAPVVCGTYEPAPWQNALGRFANLDWHLYWFRFIPAETDSFSMGNVAFHRDVYFNRERLEEHFFHRTAAAEDTLVAMTIAEQHRILSTGQLWVYHMHRDRLGDYVRKHITTGFSRTLLSMAFPQRKVFSARDIRLTYVLPQLFSTALLAVSVLTTAAGQPPVFLGAALAFFVALQIPSLGYIASKERSPAFVLMALALFGVRNLAWGMGLLRALAYVLTSPPELAAAANWRAKQNAPPAEPDPAPDEAAGVPVVD